MILRPELFHPLSVHFPIVLITFSLLLKIVNLFYKRGRYLKELSSIYLGLIISSLIAVAVSIYLGDMAAENVKGKICQISQIDRHEDFSKMLMLVLMILLAWEILNTVILEKKEGTKKVLNYLSLLQLPVSILFIIFLGLYLFQTAHTGAALVYEQGAAVLNHSLKCH